MKDRELIRLIRDDPERGIAIAVDCYGGTVRAVCRSILRKFQPEDIDEACSDTFVKLWKYADRFDESKSASLKTYICVLARNTSLDMCRKKSREPLDDLSEYDVIDFSINLEEDFARHCNEELIHEAMNEMGEPERSVFILRFFYLFPIKEISEQLDIKPKQVENILFRRKEKLRAILLEKGVLYEKDI